MVCTVWLEGFPQLCLYNTSSKLTKFKAAAAELSPKKFINDDRELSVLNMSIGV
jgi:hypothetical protein